MAVIKGSKVTLLVGDGESPEAFSIIAGSRNASISLGGDEIDTTSADDIADGVTWRSYISGIADLTLSGAFIIKDAATYQRIIGDRLNDTVRNYRANVEGYGLFAGPGRITVANIAGQFDDIATYDVTIRAAGAWTHTNETSAPTNTLLPSISGIAQEAQILTAIPGIWTGGLPTFSYQWQADDAGNGTFVDISGATSRTYTIPQTTYTGDRIRVVVTATNAHSAVSANSAPTAIVIAD